jgi:hypothetical protein
MKRLAKVDYFQKRMNEAKASGDTAKAFYYEGRYNAEKANKEQSMKGRKVEKVAEKIQEHIDNILGNGKRTPLINTPTERDELDAFASRNNGDADHVLTEMAVRHGVLIAMQTILKQLEE